jgi:hypothetical protein
VAAPRKSDKELHVKTVYIGNRKRQNTSWAERATRLIKRPKSTMEFITTTLDWEGRVLHVEH